MNIKNGLPQNLKSDVADLYLNALGEKFIPILGDRAEAKKLLELSINESNCFSAVSGSELLGVLAFQVKDMSFLSISFKEIKSVYGFFRGIFKFIGLSMLSHNTNLDEIYVEAIAVSESARGQGVGSKLFDALFEYAKINNYKRITLQVIDTNPKAKELYERLNFRTISQSKIWPINKIIAWPFSKIYFMEKTVETSKN